MTLNSREAAVLENSIGNFDLLNREIAVMLGISVSTLRRGIINNFSNNSTAKDMYLSFCSFNHINNWYIGDLPVMRLLRGAVRTTRMDAFLFVYAPLLSQLYEKQRAQVPQSLSPAVLEQVAQCYHILQEEVLDNAEHLPVKVKLFLMVLCIHSFFAGYVQFDMGYRQDAIEDLETFEDSCQLEDLKCLVLNAIKQGVLTKDFMKPILEQYFPSVEEPEQYYRCTKSVLRLIGVDCKYEAPNILYLLDKRRPVVAPAYDLKDSLQIMCNVIANVPVRCNAAHTELVKPLLDLVYL